VTLTFQNTNPLGQHTSSKALTQTRHMSKVFKRGKLENIRVRNKNVNQKDHR